MKIKPLHIWIFLSLMVAVAIFISSSIEGAASAVASMAVVDRLRQFFDINIGRHALNTIVRNVAHVVVFFLLGFCLASALRRLIKNRWFVFWLSWGIAAAYGVLDEIHQYFVPGRIFLVSDMIINAFGALLGVSLALVLGRKKS